MTSRLGYSLVFRIHASAIIINDALCYWTVRDLYLGKYRQLPDELIHPPILVGLLSGKPHLEFPLEED
jgi:hypothetical protein